MDEERIKRTKTTEQLQAQIKLLNRSAVVLNDVIKEKNLEIKKLQNKIVDLRRIIKNQRKLLDKRCIDGEE